MLWDFQKNVEANGGVTSNNILLEKARQIWIEYPQLCREEHGREPEFSSGWIENFKKRRSIKLHIRQGEASSVPSEAAASMVVIKRTAGDVDDEDIYSMDEAGLFWRMAVNSGLSSKSTRGLKADKSRISIIVCTNASGSKKMPLWFIGKAESPKPFRNVNLNSVECTWKSNSKAWLTGEIMADWLSEFYRFVGDRQVLLTMDNFSGHRHGLEFCPPPPNVKYAILPANSTSIYQPLDQGIIRSLKCHYRKQWLAFACNSYSCGRDPVKELNILQAVEWASGSWAAVTPNTIFNCFVKSTLMCKTVSVPVEIPIEMPDISQEFDETVAAGRSSGQIREALSLLNFLNPPDENMPNEEAPLTHDEIMAEVISRHLPEEDDDDTGPDPPPLPQNSEAQFHLQELLRYIEGTLGTPKQVLALRDIKVFLDALAPRKRQRTIDEFFFATAVNYLGSDLI